MNLKINIEELAEKFIKQNPNGFIDEREKEMSNVWLRLFATWLDSLNIEKVIGNKK